MVVVGNKEESARGEGYIRRGNMVMFGFGFDRRPIFGEVAAHWITKEVRPAGGMRGDVRSNLRPV